MRVFGIFVCLIFLVATTAWADSGRQSLGVCGEGAEEQREYCDGANLQAGAFDVAQFLEGTLEEQRVQIAACCKTCRKGKACGDSCISKSKTCKKGVGCACDAE